MEFFNNTNHKWYFDPDTIIQGIIALALIVIAIKLCFLQPHVGDTNFNTYNYTGENHEQTAQAK